MPINKLDPEARARVIGSIILLTIGGIALVVLSWLALRIGRRHALREDQLVTRRERDMNPDDWAEKPLVTDPSDQTSDTPI